MNESQKRFIERVQKHWFLRNVFNDDVCLFIACQFALESAFGTSKLALCQNNYCGMKLPKYRYGKYYSFKPCDFAFYHSFDDCIIDYVCWVLYFRPSLVNLGSAAHYASWIELKYCPDKDYVQNIVSLYNQFKNVN